MLAAGCAAGRGAGEPTPNKAPETGAPPAAAAPAAGDGWTSLFDGRALGSWKPTSFGGGEGEVRVQDGNLILETGSPLTGATWAGGEIPHMDYELRLEAMKLDGGDFFCGLTFPVGPSACSFIVGGWGGGVVGLSSLDGHDAANNETARHMVFEKNRWYRIRVRVSEGAIEAWIDDQSMVDADTTGRKISVRSEVEPSKPLGVASFATRAALRGIEVRKI
jgi:hypothetical protein